VQTRCGFSTATFNLTQSRSSYKTRIVSLHVLLFEEVIDLCRKQHFTEVLFSCKLGRHEALQNSFAWIRRSWENLNDYSVRTIKVRWKVSDVQSLIGGILTLEFAPLKQWCSRVTPFLQIFSNGSGVTPRKTNILYCQTVCSEISINNQQSCLYSISASFAVAVRFSISAFDTAPLPIKLRKPEG